MIEGKFDMKVIVLGAGGFVGGWISELLSEQPGWTQLACVRRWASAVRVARRGINARQLDLGDRSDLSKAIAGAEVVINATMPLPSQEAGLVKAVYEVCIDSGVHRFVHLSSAAVYGRRAGTVNEEASPSPNDEYSRGKAATEDGLIGAARSTTPITIFRPSIIYGPFSDAWTVRYVERVLRGNWKDLGRVGEGICNLIYAEDVARAVICAAGASGIQKVQIFNVNGSEQVTWNDYIGWIGNELGASSLYRPNALKFRSLVVVAEALRRAGRFNMARALYRGSRGATQTAMKRAQAVTKLYPTLGELSLLGRKAYYSPELARRVLGFTPSVQINEGIRQSIAWCRRHGVV